MSGRADAAVGELIVFDHLMDREKIAGYILSGEAVIGGVNYTQLNIAARKDQPILASILTKAMAVVSPEAVKFLHQNWIGITATP